MTLDSPRPPLGARASYPLGPEARNGRPAAGPPLFERANDGLLSAEGRQTPRSQGGPRRMSSIP